MLSIARSISLASALTSFLNSLGALGRLLNRPLYRRLSNNDQGRFAPLQRLAELIEDRKPEEPVKR